MFELTRQERQAVVFVLAISLAGTAIEFLVRHAKPVERRQLLDHLGKIDLNSADCRMLERLPGVGPALAQRIVAYREENGGFSEVEDLARVKGVRPALIGKLRGTVYIR